MELFENPNGKKMEDLLSEEPESHEHTAAKGQVNDDDFSVDNFDIPAAAEEKKPAEAKPQAEPETVVRVEKETTKDPEGKTVVKEVTTTEHNKHSAFVSAFKPEVAILFGNMMLERVGGVFWPDKPRSYWSLSPQDRADLAVLTRESASEGSWSGIPSKYLLMFIVLLIVGGKIYHANRPTPPGQGDPQNKPSDGSDPVGEAKRRFDEGKSSQEAKNGPDEAVSKLNIQIKALEEQNSLLKRLLDKKVEEAKAVPFEDIIEPLKTGGNIYKGYDLDVISFTKNGALIDPTRAGTKGFTSDGKRVGQPSKEILELWGVWKKHKSKVNQEA